LYSPDTTDFSKYATDPANRRRNGGGTWRWIAHLIMRVGMLANAFNLECTPLPNAYWFEMPHPANLVDRPYHKEIFRVDKEGYVHAPTAPGLSLPLDRNGLDKMLKRIDT